MPLSRSYYMCVSGFFLLVSSRCSHLNLVVAIEPIHGREHGVPGNKIYQQVHV